MQDTIYEACGQMQGLLDLAHAWHRRCLADPIVSHAFSHGFHPEHSERLAAYWAEALGGPTLYSSALSNETEVRKMHAGNGVHLEMDEAAQQCFVAALDDVGIEDHRLRSTLEAYFRWATGLISAYPRSIDDVPSGLGIAHWSWDGPL